jgi:hypothetical protein
LPDSKSGEGNLVWVRVPPPARQKAPAKGMIINEQRDAPTPSCRGQW